MCTDPGDTSPDKAEWRRILDGAQSPRTDVNGFGMSQKNEHQSPLISNLRVSIKHGIHNRPDSIKHPLLMSRAQSRENQFNLREKQLSAQEGMEFVCKSVAAACKSTNPLSILQES